ncbi:MAG: NADH-quinone oxidoreductase subunit N [Candidatus Micrarchaeia archaeon]
MITLFETLAMAVSLYMLLNIIARMTNNKKLHFALTVFLLASIFSLLLMILYSDSFGTHFDSMLSINQFSSLISLMITFGMLLVQFIAYSEPVYQDFSLLSSFSFFGMLLVIMSTSILTLFIGLELLTIPTVISLLLSRKWLEAGIKYFVVVALSAGLFAFGAATFFLLNGNLQITAQNTAGDIIALLFFVVAIGIESGIFPFNLWIPDVYQGSPGFITSMLGGLNKKVGIVALIYIMLVIFPYISQNLLIFFAVLTMFYGNLAALMQKNVKRILAYSSISQVGYILIGLSTLGRYGLSASIFQIFAHMFAFIGIFAVIALLETKGRIETKDYIGLNSENKFMALTLSVLLLSMAGIPFTAGFVGKFLLFSSAVYSNLVWLAILGIINTVISVYYYAKIIIAVYTNKKDARHVRADFSISFAALASLAIIIFFGVYPAPMISLAQAAAAILI